MRIGCGQTQGLQVVMHEPEPPFGPPPDMEPPPMPPDDHGGDRGQGSGGRGGRGGRRSASRSITRV
ncbi:MAG: hypothetical protein AAFN74_27880, partial [Myxococcota bacterium]